jgi:conjugal transfer pilus assembly protein TraA
MRITNKLKAMAATLMFAAMSAPAYAAGASEDDAFKEFMDTVTDWTQGPLGIGLATTMLLMGGAIGVSKNSPMPALSGIAGAAFLNYGPNIIQSIMSKGMLF